jgi:hypothetical protein
VDEVVEYIESVRILEQQGRCSVSHLFQAPDIVYPVPGNFNSRAEIAQGHREIGILYPVRPDPDTIGIIDRNRPETLFELIVQKAYIPGSAPDVDGFEAVLGGPEDNVAVNSDIARSGICNFNGL